MMTLPLEPTQQSASFAAGTLVHTPGGCVPIENIRVGDTVLSRPEQGGEATFKRVLRTFNTESTALCRLKVSGESRSQTLIVTAAHPFHVAGYNPEGFDPEHFEEFIQGRCGWRRADLIVTGALLALADGGTAAYRDIQRIWRTGTEGIGWVQLSLDSFPTGINIDMRTGQYQSGAAFASTEFALDESFRDRLEDENLSEHWSYQCTVYGLELEDFHTYYVGELGLWVADAVSSDPGREWQYRYNESD